MQDSVNVNRIWDVPQFERGCGIGKKKKAILGINSLPAEIMTAEVRDAGFGKRDKDPPFQDLRLRSAKRRTRYTGKVKTDNDDHDYHDGCESNDYKNDDGSGDNGRHGDKGGGGEDDDDDDNIGVDDPLMPNYAPKLGPLCFILHTVIRKN